MAATEESDGPNNDIYELVVWDYDPAPDGEGYYVYGHWRGLSFADAVRCARHSTNDLCCVGAAIYKADRTMVRGFGALTLDYPTYETK